MSDQTTARQNEASAIAADTAAVREFCLARGIPYEDPEPEKPKETEVQKTLF